MSNKEQISKAGDLSQLAKDIESLLMQMFGESERPSVALAFTLPRDYSEVHFVTNLSRPLGIQVFEGAAEKMKAQAN